MKKQYWVFTIIILLLLGGAFYWFQLRPSQIRKECYKTAEYWSDGIYWRHAEEINFHWTQCLRNHGLLK